MHLRERSALWWRPSAPSQSSSASASVKSGCASGDYQSPLDFIPSCFLPSLRSIDGKHPPTASSSRANSRGCSWPPVSWHNRVPVEVRRLDLGVCGPTLGRPPGMVLVLLTVLVVVRARIHICLPVKWMRTVRRSSPRWSLSTSLLKCGLNLPFLRLCWKAVRSVVFVWA